MVKVLKYVENSYKNGPSFLIEMDGIEYLSNGCVFIENTKENIEELVERYNCKNYIDELLNSKDIEDISEVTNMSFMFNGIKYFNQNISNWDVSNVTDMSFMFQGVIDFNQDLSSWNVSNVKNMAYMFGSTDSFNQDISNWDVSNVTDMSWMFDGSTSFSQDLSSWNVSNEAETRYMFQGTKLEENPPSWYTNKKEK